ncbi:hypothetical protein D3870_12365 [Noviherbaspirillum cavernae]|uniref:Uncharacterized protein n=2 Tax=Noviherbaspirillum cavernae TaxID=2320862 RepID=A0A418X2L3_9BURK|nr:hypothetical protein D3870_12365 [Noviherbaspirillum cavernae]
MAAPSCETDRRNRSLFKAEQKRFREENGLITFSGRARLMTSVEYSDLGNFVNLPGQERPTIAAHGVHRRST